VTTISVELSPQEEEQLRERAQALKITPEALAAAVLKNGLTRDEPTFTAAAAEILEKNRELYRRLS
jgi:hypothetical protein